MTGIKKTAVLTLPSGTGDTEDIINYGMMIATVEVAMLLQKTHAYRTRVSLRSRDSVDVGKIAVSLGGGGHTRAAGCTINKNLTQTKKMLLREIHKII
ncbi:MAG: DHHA1 domain-containing protein [bacterium]